MARIVNTADMHREDFEHLIRPHMPPLEFDETMLAYKISKHAHRGQTRDGGLRYFDHGRSVAVILIVELQVFDPPRIRLALFHDMQEDCKDLWQENRLILSFKDVAVIFGDAEAHRFRTITKEPGKDYFRGLYEADVETIEVKLCDRLHNLRNVVNEWPPDRMLKYLIETREKYFAMIDRYATLLYPTDRWRADYLRNEFELCCAEIEAAVTAAGLARPTTF